MTVTVVATGRVDRDHNGHTRVVHTRRHPGYRPDQNTGTAPTTTDPNQDLPPGWDQPPLFKD